MLEQLVWSAFKLSLILFTFDIKIYHVIWKILKAYELVTSHIANDVRHGLFQVFKSSLLCGDHLLKDFLLNIV